MRASLIITLLLCVYTDYLYADITIRYDAISNKLKQPAHVVMLKQQFVRIDQKAGRQPDVMMNLATGDIVQLDSKSKSFFRINAQTLNQYVSLYRQNSELMQGLISQGIQQLSPQQRSQIELMLQQYEQSPSSVSAISLKNTGNIDQVLGVQCRIVAIFDHAQHVRDVCLADYRQLELKTADIAGFEKLKKLVQQFKQSSPEQQDMLSILANGAENLNGIPLKMVQYNADGNIRSILQAGSISFRTVPDVAYQIPQDYQQKMVPFL